MQELGNEANCSCVPQTNIKIITLLLQVPRSSYQTNTHTWPRATHVRAHAHMLSISRAFHDSYTHSIMVSRSKPASELNLPIFGRYTYYQVVHHAVNVFHVILNIRTT